jgi:hypothetical protein
LRGGLLMVLELWGGGGGERDLEPQNDRTKIVKDGRYNMKKGPHRHPTLSTFLASTVLNINEKMQNE